MPFKSEKQRRFLWAEHPDIAKRWAHEYPNQKKLPMYAHKDKPSDSKEKDSESEEKHTKVSYQMNYPLLQVVNKYVNNQTPRLLTIRNPDNVFANKQADSKQEIVDVPHNPKPTYAGEERQNGEIKGDISLAKNISNPNSGDSLAGDGTAKKRPMNAINDLLGKLAFVLSPNIEQTMENMNAEAEGRVARILPKNRMLKKYPAAALNIPLPMAMQQQYAQSQPQQPQQPTARHAGQMRPVGGGSHPQFNPINAFGAISLSGQLNGNAAFGAKNSPDSSKIAKVIKRASRSEVLGKLMGLETTDPDDIEYYNEEFEEELQHKTAGEYPVDLTDTDIIASGLAIEKWAGKQLGLWDRIRMKRERGEKPAKKGDKDYPDAKSWKKVTSISEKEAGSPAWQRSEGKNEEGGLNAKGRASYNKATGGHLKAPVTESNPKGDRAKRRHSFCARMCGMKRVNTGSGTAKDPDSRINKSLRKWNCKCSSAMDFGIKMADAPFLAPTTNPADPRTQLNKLMGPQQTQAYRQRLAGGVSAMDKLMGKTPGAAARTPTPAAGGGAPNPQSALLGGGRGGLLGHFMGTGTR